VRFNLTDALLEREKVHEMLDELVDKPPVDPLPQDTSGYGTLSHTQKREFQYFYGRSDAGNINK
jgi:hypothetical protein